MRSVPSAVRSPRRGSWLRATPALAALVILWFASSVTAADALRPPGVPFDELARQAETLRASGQDEAALRAYAAALELDPDWRDGLWRTGQLEVAAGRLAAGRVPLLRLVALEPGAGAAWALLGLCEYGLGAHDQALAYLWKGTSLGLEDETLRREASLHFALELVRQGDFVAAAKPLVRLCVERYDSPLLPIATGLLGLRRRSLPEELAPDELALVRATGVPSCDALALRLDEAERGFETLVARHPTAPGVHFLYGLFLRRQASPRGRALLEDEVRLFPENAEAQAELAFEILDRGRAADAMAPARASVRVAPESGRSRLALGRVLVATGDLAGGIAELEQAASRIPDDADVQLALARAYASAGRTADLERVRIRLRGIDRRRGSS